MTAASPPSPTVSLAAHGARFAGSAAPALGMDAHAQTYPYHHQLPPTHVVHATPPVHRVAAATLEASVPPPTMFTFHAPLSVRNMADTTPAHGPASLATGPDVCRRLLLGDRSPGDGAEAMDTGDEELAAGAVLLSLARVRAVVVPRSALACSSSCWSHSCLRLIPQSLVPRLVWSYPYSCFALCRR